MWNMLYDLLPRSCPRTLWRDDRAAFWYAALFWTFWLSLASFPIGYGAREVLPPLCAVFLCCYYRHAWSRSVWRRLTLRPLFYCLWAMIALGVLFSEDMLSSLLHAGTGLNKGFILPIIGMECVRDGRDLRRLVAACVVACFWEGLDGIRSTADASPVVWGIIPSATTSRWPSSRRWAAGTYCAAMPDRPKASPFAPSC